jgi:branched-chain amino acid aminotransferase
MIKELLKLDKSWIPEGDGYSLYIRPNIFATTVGYLSSWV